MPIPFTLQGRLGQAPYAVWSVAAFVVQHLAVWLATGRIPEFGLSINPFAIERSGGPLIIASSASAALFAVSAAVFLVVWILSAWALAALSFRRTVDADRSETLAILAILPLLQIVVILFLCLAPSSTRTEQLHRDPVAAEVGWRTAVEGALAGIALTMIAVLVGAVFFRVYGVGLFMLSPIAIGATTAFLANRKGDIGLGRTNFTVVGATALGGAALLAAAFEGFICILLAAPLAFGMAVIGGLVGRGIALARHRSPGHTLSGLAVVPLIYAAEAAVPPFIAFDSVQVIEINASPDAVWHSIAHMTPLEEPAALPFRLGVAYPTRGEIIGEGVGALRRGYFSTGVAIERVTAWEPNRRLTFVVESDPPAMEELSPYQHVLSQHVLGYFHTRFTSFELAPGPNGHTVLTERTAHELKLDPAVYWLPMAEWAVSANNARVLAHIKRDAEGRFN